MLRIVLFQNQLFPKIETREEILKHIFDIMLHARSSKQITNWNVICTHVDDFSEFACFSLRHLKIKLVKTTLLEYIEIELLIS